MSIFSRVPLKNSHMPERNNVIECVYSIQNKTHINFLLKHHNYMAEFEACGLRIVVIIPGFCRLSVTASNSQ